MLIPINMIIVNVNNTEMFSIILKPRCSSNEDSPAITISLTCGKKPEDAPTRFILYGIANWNGSENGLSKFIKLIQVDDIIFSEPFQESSYVFENKSCFLTMLLNLSSTASVPRNLTSPGPSLSFTPKA